MTLTEKRDLSSGHPGQNGGGPEPGTTPPKDAVAGRPRISLLSCLSLSHLGLSFLGKVPSRASEGLVVLAHALFVELLELGPVEVVVCGKRRRRDVLEVLVVPVHPLQATLVMLRDLRGGEPVVVANAGEPGGSRAVILDEAAGGEGRGQSQRQEKDRSDSSEQVGASFP